MLDAAPLSFVTAAPLTLSAEDPVSRVQVAKTGAFQDPRYGKFKITAADFAAWKRSLAKALEGEGVGLPVDVDHGPEKGQRSEAAGWIVGLDSKGKDGATSTPGELWATVEWTTLGVQLVGEKRYRFFSPTYHPNAKDENGNDRGNVMFGGALTNRPFLSMAVVTLDAGELFAEEVPDEPADSRRAMPTLLDALRSALSLSADTPEAEVQTKALAAVAGTPAPGAGPVNLNALAAAEGKLLISLADHTSLEARALAGDQATKTLAEQKFTLAWDTAFEKGAVLPAQKETFEQNYKVAPDVTVSILEGLQPVVQTDTTGASGSGAGQPAGSDAAKALEADLGSDEAVDEGTAALHAAVVSLMQKTPGLTYDAALTAVYNGGN